MLPLRFQGPGIKSNTPQVEQNKEATSHRTSKTTRRRAAGGGGAVGTAKEPSLSEDMLWNEN